MPVTSGQLAEVLVEALGIEDQDPAQIDPTAPLFGEGLGLDSLDMLELSLVIQQRWGVRLKADDPQNATIFASLQSLARYISEQQPAA